MTTGIRLMIKTREPEFIRDVSGGILAFFQPKISQKTLQSTAFMTRSQGNNFNQYDWHAAFCAIIIDLKSKIMCLQDEFPNSSER
uniref:Uncharacterized protein n=1 Tax=Romanomermis culicivorax TaxID=13658 RepID=A0A915JXH5_ROMCU